MSDEESEWWRVPKSSKDGTVPRDTKPLKPVQALVLTEMPRIKDPEEPSAKAEVSETEKPDRRRSLIIGAVGAALVGIVVFAAMPDGGPDGNPAVVEATTSPETFLPPAGGMPSGAADEVPMSSEESRKPAAPAEGVVALLAEPAGKGDTGALVKVTIRNGTDDAVVVMSSMMRGDGRSAMVGEGTLAPGSRKIGPGETATGTVEFVAKKPPSQVVLMDLSGKVVATS